MARRRSARAWNRLAGLPILLFLMTLAGCNHPPAPADSPPKPFVSDGCSCFPDLDVGSCCRTHDRSYWAGGTPRQRQAADEVLRRCVAAKGHPWLARIMYWGVRIGGHGWLPTPWRWGFGHNWPQGYFTPATLQVTPRRPAQLLAMGRSR